VFVAFPAVFTLIIYIIYWVEVFTSATYKYLQNFLATEGVYEHIQRIRGTTPGLDLHCRCYHYETQTYYETEHYTDSHGHSKSRQVLRTRTVEVTTYRESEPFRFTTAVDQSGDLSEEVTRFNIVRIKMSEGFSFGDNYTAQVFNEQKNHFIARNQCRDTHFQQWDSYATPGFQKHMMSAVNKDSVPGCMKINWFVLSSFLFASWFYRLWLDRISVAGKYHVNKWLYLTPPPVVYGAVPTVVVHHHC